MPDAGRRTITLPPDQAEYVDALVAAGAYASASEVISAGLEALQSRQLDMERWLRDDVIPVYDAMETDPGRGVSADAVLEAIDARHAARVRAAKRGD